MGNYKNGLTLTDLLKSEKVQKKFIDVTGKNPAAFTSALLAVVNGNEKLQECEPKSILSAAVCAASLNLQIDPSQGQAYLVPFKGKAQLQIGFRGYVQLALRTGQYKKLHAGVIREGEIRGINPLTGEFTLGEKISDEVTGYAAHFELVNGFSKTLYMSKAEAEEHAKNYSQTYAADRNKTWSMWAKNFDQMATKTVLKKLLKNWGILSVERQTAIQADQSVVEKNSFTYVDNGGHSVERNAIEANEKIPAITSGEPEFVNNETGEVLFAEENSTDTEISEIGRAHV